MEMLIAPTFQYNLLGSWKKIMYVEDMHGAWHMVNMR